MHVRIRERPVQQRERGLHPRRVRLRTRVRHGRRLAQPSFTRVAGPLSVGASYQAATKAHGLPQHKAGPQLRLAIPRGVVTVEVLEGIKRFSDEVRVAVRVGF